MLRKGNFATLEREYIKEDTKLLCCMYGNNNNLNYKLKIDQLKQKGEHWNFVRSNICDKFIVIKTYFIGSFQYQMRAFKMSDTFMKKINFILFTFLASSRRDKNCEKIFNARKKN